MKRALAGTTYRLAWRRRYAVPIPANATVTAAPGSSCCVQMPASSGDAIFRHGRATLRDSVSGELAQPAGGRTTAAGLSYWASSACLKQLMATFGRRREQANDGLAEQHVWCRQAYGDGGCAGGRRLKEAGGERATSAASCVRAKHNGARMPLSHDYRRINRAANVLAGAWAAGDER